MLIDLYKRVLCMAFLTEQYAFDRETEYCDAQVLTTGKTFLR